MPVVVEALSDEEEEDQAAVIAQSAVEPAVEPVVVASVDPLVRGRNSSASISSRV